MTSNILQMKHANITIEGLRKTGFKVMVNHEDGYTSIFLTNPEGETFFGHSSCHEKDNFNRKLGNHIALGRALKGMKNGKVVKGFDEVMAKFKNK